MRVTLLDSLINSTHNLVDIVDTDLELPIGYFYLLMFVMCPLYHFCIFLIINFCIAYLTTDCNYIHRNGPIKIADRPIRSFLADMK